MRLKDGRTSVMAISCNSLLERIGLLNASCPIGSVEASKRITKGGCVPGGIAENARLAMAVTSAAAWAMFVPS